MQPNPELKRLILRLYEKKASGGLFDFARDLYSRRDGALLIGSEPGDWFQGYEAIMRFYEVAGAADLEIRVEELNAFGDVGFGWVTDQVMVRLPNGIEIPVRHTYVFQREDDGWRIVHAHISIGVPDESLGE